MFFNKGECRVLVWAAATTMNMEADLDLEGKNYLISIIIHKHETAGPLIQSHMVFAGRIMSKHKPVESVNMLCLSSFMPCGLLLIGFFTQTWRRTSWRWWFWRWSTLSLSNDPSLWVEQSWVDGEFFSVPIDTHGTLNSDTLLTKYIATRRIRRTRKRPWGTTRWRRRRRSAWWRWRMVGAVRTLSEFFRVEKSVANYLCSYSTSQYQHRNSEIPHS